ncbi:hypothetical protein V6N13_064192 [Hibiscus sabdariffa]|uniref:Uncharacterized protein n=1 Tax=Hibiscus sabdariffa TaxID=183260 RepID=A0ABR2ASA8_9ROSI
MDCRCVTTFLSNWKAFVRTSGLIGGFDPKTALAMVITPAFWLLSPANATAAAESGKCNSRCVPQIVLEVDQTNGENENISWI